MKTFNIYISETYAGYVCIEANNQDEAEELARDKLINGDIKPVEEFNANILIEGEDL